MLPQYIVVIGGSGGSLDPLIEFFDYTPLDNASYIILRHLPYNYQSTLDLVLHRHSQLRIAEAVNNCRIENNTVYFAPPGKQMIIEDSKLLMIQRVEGPSKAIDIFLKSLSENVHKKRTIVVILSGGDTDGIEGVELIKKAGGLIIAQSPETCRYPKLPEEVIATGFVDHVLHPKDMPVIIQAHTSKKMAD